MRRKIEYPEREKPIYRFQLNEDGYVERLEPITRWSSSVTRIAFKVGTTESSICRDNMDKPIKGRIYTFLDDQSRAERLIKAHLEMKMRTAEMELDKAKKAYYALKF